MLGLRTRATGTLSGPFLLSIFCTALAPTSLGYQDLAALFGRQPSVSARWRTHLIASPFGTIDAATFDFSLPVGTAIPEPAGAQPVGFDPRVLDVKVWSLVERPAAGPALAIEYPSVDRRDKSDRIPVRPRAPSPAAAAAPGSPRLAAVFASDEDSAARRAQLYFGVSPLGTDAGLQPWAPGAEPVPVAPASDRDVPRPGEEPPAAAGAKRQAGAANAGRFESPAERLGLSGKARAKAEKCIADAVYFEARGEPLRGQMAVAQVVMNRVFSGRYPRDVCGVVFQNADHHLACQFTFACEGKDLNRIDEPEMWKQAKFIAKDALDGKIWLSEVGHATHYHASWVHPSWVHEMAKLYQLGVHTFYRPRLWGDGSDAPIWSSVTATPKPAGAATNHARAARTYPVAAGNRDAEAKSPQAAAAPAEALGKLSTARL